MIEPSDASSPVVPFRWDVSRREGLGSLLEGPRTPSYRGFEADLLRAASGVLAAAGEADLIGLGRSPEELIELLRGLLADTSWTGRAGSLLFSCGDPAHLPRIAAEHPGSVRSMKGYLEHLGLSPRALLARPRPVAIVDCVASGWTFRSLRALLRRWTVEQRADWRGVAAKLRFVALLEPAACGSWEWRRWLLPCETRKVRVTDALWWHLVECDKTVASHPVARWADPRAVHPPREERHLRALRRARDLFELGLSPESRREVARRLSTVALLRRPWLRGLVHELRPRTREPPRGRGRAGLKFEPWLSVALVSVALGHVGREARA